MWMALLVMVWPCWVWILEFLLRFHVWVPLGIRSSTPPPCVTGGDGTYDAAVEAVSFDDDDLVAYGQVGSSSQHTRPFAVPLSPRVSTRSGSGMACRKSCRSQSRSGDERPPLHPDSHRSSRHRSSLPSPAKHV